MEDRRYSDAQQTVVNLFDGLMVRLGLLERNKTPWSHEYSDYMRWYCMVDRKCILVKEYQTGSGVMEFYDDGTYRRTGGEISYWRYEGGMIHISHHAYTVGNERRWIPLDERSGAYDREVAAELIEAIEKRIEQELFD